MKLKWFFVIIALEFLALLYVLRLLDLLDLKTGTTLGVVEMVVAILAWLLHERSEGKRIETEEERRQKEKSEQEKNKKREKLERYIHEHNQKLIGTYIKPWYEDKMVNYANEPFATQHLQTGYIDIWGKQQESNSLRDSLSSKEQSIKDCIKNKLKEGISSNFAWSNELEDTEIYIYNSLIKKVAKNTDIISDDKSHTQIPIPIINIVYDSQRTDLAEQAENFEKLIKIIIEDKTLYERLKKLDETRRISYNKIGEFFQGLKQIEHDFEARHIELKGVCRDCNDWHKELESLK